METPSAIIVPSSACPWDGRKPAAGQQQSTWEQGPRPTRRAAGNSWSALLHYHKNAIAFYGWAPWPDFWLLQCLVLVRFILRSSPKMKWIAAFPGLNCLHQLKALPVMKIHPLFLSEKRIITQPSLACILLNISLACFQGHLMWSMKAAGGWGLLKKSLKNQGSRDTKAAVSVPQSA